MKKIVKGALVAASVAMIGGVVAGPASAGEITGGGTLKEVKANSLCAFSGQNDGYHDGTEAERVQSFGQLVRIGIKPILVAEGETPGNLCNGHNIPLHQLGGGDL